MKNWLKLLLIVTLLTPVFGQAEFLGSHGPIGGNGLNNGGFGNGVGGRPQMRPRQGKMGRKGMVRRGKKGGGGRKGGGKKGGGGKRGRR